MKYAIILLFALFGFSLSINAQELGAPWFEDSFESGDFSTSSKKGEGSLRWSSSNVSVSSSYAKTGSYSARFVFGPNADGEDSWRELGFRFDSGVPEIWVEYWILYPDNYYHRSQSGSSNNKFFQLNYNGAPKQLLTVESAVQGGGASLMRRFLSTTQKPDGSNNWPVNDSDTSNFIGSSSEFAIQLGQWTKVRIYYKAGSDGIKNDGRAEVWINDKLFHALDWPFWEPDNQGWINGGYVLGWSNSGFSQATSIYVDDFKVYTTEPSVTSNPRPNPPSDFKVNN
ncbi:hypothetical protein EHN06_11505 [Marinobacter sp. NP-4(2019)]|uniref:hypothetical protein n=1 Tax=Marinobacter sp. NP-4(2019) TaxID=2488665 RepID=UPI000FC3E1EB|nr:hypothetical protein [Marinobacter sp. NP-4(2019)]AZT84112.1 hypothetical protein EHN06_11505 [Marinobacter sp. NP-4(2019)]